MVETQKRVDVTRFHKFDELTEILTEFVDRFPKLVSLDSMGKSHEGRYIWVLSITNGETGPAGEKPTMYIDGNIHAGEVTGCNVALYTADMLLNGYGSDDT
ncbi:MAG: carboxypeptidase, partial [Chloroflexia bacterium]|nr:carboxypeptidase [Chloroflexia bacterium]